MKAIILAGGLGSRLGEYTKDIPKCMLNFQGKSLLERQIDTYRACGVHEIIVVRKHLADKITMHGVRYIDETDYSTHMVVGFFCARSEFNDDIIMSYGDILFEDRVLQTVLKNRADVGVVADSAWKDYWTARYDDPREDLESFELGDEERILSLGIPNPPDDKIHARYVGMVKFSQYVLPKIERIYDRASHEFWEKPWYTSDSFKKAYMTDFIQSLIDHAIDVRAIRIQHGWLEFDTVKDYTYACDWAEHGRLCEFFHLGK
ncbi:MAG: NTP transferase domain-containing protein [bacterium]